MSGLTVGQHTGAKFDPSQTIAGGKAADQPAGVGALGGGQPVPDAGTPTGPGALATFQAIMDSIVEMMPGTDSDDNEVKLLEVTVKLRELEDLVNKKKIEVDTAKKREALSEKQAKLDEAQKKIDEAEEKQRNMSIWDKIKLAFQWLGAILSIIIGAVMIATGVGAVAGGLLIAAGVAGIIMAIDATMKEASPDKLGIAGQISHNLMGKSLEEAQNADMIFGYVMVAISIALAIASLGAAFGPAIANAVAGGSSAALQTAEAVSNAAISGSQVAAQASMTAKMVQQVLTVVNDALTIATAVGDGVTAGMKYEATNLAADGKELQALAKQLEAFMQLIDDMIDQSIARLKASSERFDSMVEDLIAAVQDRGQSLAQAKFKG